MFFCYKCLIPIVEGFPQLDLPVKFSVVKHPKEKIGKSSIIVSKIIGGEKVEIISQLEFPDFDVENTVLLFPDETAI